jgi:hypothetical protein
MATQEIPRDQWPTFFDEFSRQYEGALGRIETIGTDIGDQQTATLPFQGVSFDAKGSESGSVIVLLGTEIMDHLERVIQNPASVQVKPAGAAGPAVLEIRMDDDTTVLLHLERALALNAPD